MNNPVKRGESRPESPTSVRLSERITAVDLPLARRDKPNLELYFMRSDSRRVRSEKRRQRMRMKLRGGNEFAGSSRCLKIFCIYFLE